MFLEWIIELFEWGFFGDSAILLAFGMAAMTLIVGGVCAYRLKSDGVFLALFAITLGSIFIAFAVTGTPIMQTAPFFALLAITVGSAYLFYFFCRRLKERARARKKARAEKSRQLEYTLPQKENTFIRERLHTTLREEENSQTTFGEEIEFRFAYANALLNKIRAQTLSVAERLETNELAKVLALYKEKGTYVNEDVRLLGETFSRVLKLAAKYGV